MFQHDNAPLHKTMSMKSSTTEDLEGLNKALISTVLNTFQINWNPGLSSLLTKSCNQGNLCSSLRGHHLEY